MIIAPAEPRDAGAVMDLYRSLIGTEGCTWGSDYPSLEDVERDIDSRCLFVMRDEANVIIAAVAADAYGDLDDLNLWSRGSVKPCELCRLGVRRDYQNRGIARQMLVYAQDRARENGFDRMRLLVSATNLRAVRLYESAAYVYKGAARKYDLNWRCMERKL